MILEIDMISSLYNVFFSANETATASLPVASAVSVAAADESIFYDTAERTTRSEEPGIRVYGSNNVNPVIYASAVNQTYLNVEDDEAYYAAHPPATSASMTLTFFNIARSKETSSLLNKSAICMTNERQPKEAQHFNTVDIVTQTSRQGSYARKTSLFSTNDVQEVNPQDYQMVVYPSAAPR